MRFFQFVRCLSILAVFAIVASSADTDWQLASSLFTLDTSDEDWSLADPSTEVDDAVSSKTYQSLDPFSPDDDQLFVNDPQAGWLADVPPEECSSSGLAGKKRLTRSDGACSAIRVPNNNQQLSGQRSIPTDFDKIKCGAGLTSPLVLVCSSRKIMVALPYSMLFDSTRSKQTFSTSQPKHGPAWKTTFFCFCNRQYET